MLLSIINELNEVVAHSGGMTDRESIWREKIRRIEETTTRGPDFRQLEPCFVYPVTEDIRAMFEETRIREATTVKETNTVKDETNEIVVHVVGAIGKIGEVCVALKEGFCEMVMEFPRKVHAIKTLLVTLRWAFRLER